MSLQWGEHVEPPLRVRALAACYGGFYVACISALRHMVRIEDVRVPQDRVLYYSPHSDIVPGIIAARCLPGMCWVNDNTVGGYATALPALVAGLDVFRIGRGGRTEPYEQVVDMLRRRAGPVGLFTDAGRRDRRVRRSLAALGRDSGRLLVPMRVRASRSLSVDGLDVPLPGSRITVRVGLPIIPAVHAEDFVKEALLGTRRRQAETVPQSAADEAMLRERLQSALDGL